MGAALAESLLHDAQARYEGGETQESIAAALGVTKNAIAGYVNRRGWVSPRSIGPEVPVLTLFDRMNALEANLNEALRLYPPGTGMVPPPAPAPKKPRAKDWAHR